MNNKKETQEKAGLTVRVPKGVNVNDIYVKESNGIRKIYWKMNGVMSIKYQISPSFHFESDSKKIQKKLDELTGVRTGTVKNKKSNGKSKGNQVKKTSVATGEIPNGLTRNEFRVYSQSQQEWLQYIKGQEKLWNEPQQESQQEKKVVVYKQTQQKKLSEATGVQQDSKLISVINSFLSHCDTEQLTEVISSASQMLSEKL